MKKYVPLLVALLLMGTGLTTYITGNGGIGIVFIFVGIICLMFAFGPITEADR